jgi:hypothetical protein
MTPTTCFMLSETKYHLPSTAGSRPNHWLQSRSLITTASSPSAATGSRPSAGRTPRVAYMSLVGHAIGMRSTRSPARNVDVPSM